MGKINLFVDIQTTFYGIIVTIARNGYGKT